MAFKKDEDFSGGLKQLKDSLKAKNPDSLYVFCGEEDYLKSHYLEQLRKLILSGPAEEFNYHRFNSENMDLNSFQDAVEALPMMAERTFVLVDDYDIFKANESDREQLVRILSDIPDYCCVVFYYHTIEFKPDGRLKKLHAALMQNATVVGFVKQTGRELATWIRRHFLRRKKDIDDRLCQYLMFITGGTMTALASEIEKICTYAEGDIIQQTDIDAVVEPVLEAAAFDIGDAISAGNYIKAMEKVHVRLKMQEDPIKILGAVGYQMRLLRVAKMMSANQMGADAVKRVAGLSSDYPARKALSSVKNISQTFCDRAVILCAETDYQMKTSFDDPERLLDLLILRLSEEAAHG